MPHSRSRRAMSRGRPSRRASTTSRRSKSQRRSRTRTGRRRPLQSGG